MIMEHRLWAELGVRYVVVMGGPMGCLPRTGPIYASCPSVIFKKIYNAISVFI